MNKFLKDNLPWLLLTLIFVILIIVNVPRKNKDTKINPTEKRLIELNDSLEKKIAHDGTIIQFQKDYIQRIKDTVFVYNNKTNTIIKNHNENIKDINYISTNGELIKRVNSAIHTLDSIDKSTGFFIRRDTNRTMVSYPKSN